MCNRPAYTPEQDALNRRVSWILFLAAVMVGTCLYALASSRPAAAQVSYGHSYSCARDRAAGTFSCLSVYGKIYDRSARVIQAAPPAPETEEDRRDRDARLAKWESLCKPERYLDAMGMTRLRYAHARCEFGAAE